MMRKTTVLLVALIALLAPAATALAAVSSTELIENSRAYDGTVIEFQGEAIGDVMVRGESGWVNLHDGDNAIGIWAPASELRKIKTAGDYNSIGDRVLVEGRFYMACPTHDGEFDIHAERLTVVEAGARVTHPVEPGKLIAAAVLAPVALALFLFERYRRRHNVGGS
ncbi:MAG: DNA-binding protein [Actinobacteria bacterium]|nr:DNA-binding protein [Actinomycetota bacterium]